MVMSKYEETRLQRIEENKKRMEQLRLKSLARNLKTQSAKSSSKAKPPNRRMPEFVSVRRSGRNTGKPSPDYNESIQRDPSKINTKSSARMDHDQAIQRPSCLVKIDTRNFMNQLKLPAGVMNFFNGVEIPNEIALRRKSSVKGKCWFVDLVKIDGDTYVFCNAGWTEFVRDSALTFQDQIRFEYNGESQILFTVYDNESGKPKDFVSIPTVQNNVNIGLGDEDEISSDDSNYEDEHSSSDQMSLDENENGDDVLSDSGVTPTVASGESSTMGGKALVKEVERAFESASKHPFFVVSLLKSHIHNGLMRIPVAFGKKYLPTEKKKFELIMASNGGEKSWKVVTYSGRTTQYKPGQVYWRFVKGWMQCVKGSGLREGDICAFELIDRDAAKMQLSVYRVSGDTLVRTDIGDSVLGDSDVAPTVARGESSIVNGKELVKEVKRAVASKHPFFVLKLAKSYIHGGKLKIPKSFAKYHLPKASKTFRLILGSNRGTNSWKVEMWWYGRADTVWWFGTGWKECVQANGLQEGDICVFELIDKVAAKMQVSIFRVNGDTLVRTDVGN